MVENMLFATWKIRIVDDSRKNYDIAMNGQLPASLYLYFWHDLLLTSASIPSRKMGVFVSDLLFRN